MAFFIVGVGIVGNLLSLVVLSRPNLKGITNTPFFTQDNRSFWFANANPISDRGRLRQIKMCFIWYGKPVKCMQTTLLLSAADQSLNKLGGVKEL